MHDVTRRLHIGIAGPVLTLALAEFLDAPHLDAPIGMGGTNLCSLVRGLLERGHRVTVFSLDPAVHEPVTLQGNLLTLRYGPYRQRHHMRDGMRMERMAICGLIRESRPDLVNAHWAYAYALGATASGCPTLVTAHDWAPAILRYSPTPYWLARQLLYFRAVRGADQITTVSPYVCRKLQRVSRRPVTVIPNGIESSLFRGEPRSLNAESPTIISVNSGFTTRKNVTSLLAALPLVRQAIPACGLVLVGPEFQVGGPAQVWAERHGLAAGVDFRGFVPPADLCELLDQADVLVHPSREEAFGMTLIEAMARGTPVVGGCASGAVPWVLGDGDAGVLVDVLSPFDIAAGIAALLGDSALWSHYSESGYRLTRQRFSMDRVVGQYLEAYGHLLDGTD